MANDNVKSPRFWINYVEFFNRVGICKYKDVETNGIIGDSSNIVIGDIRNLVNVNPNNVIIVSTDWDAQQGEGDEYFGIRFKTGYIGMPQVRFNFGALLNHNCNESGINIYSEMYSDEQADGDDYDSYDGFPNIKGYVNYGKDENGDLNHQGGIPEQNGFSIWTHDEGTLNNRRMEEIKLAFKLVDFGDNNEGYTADISFAFSGFMAGRYFDLESPSLSIKKSIIHPSIVSNETISGSIYTNIYNTQPEFKFQLADKGITTFSNNRSRTGKRVWELNFKSYEEESLFNYFSNQQTFDSEDMDNDSNHNVPYTSNSQGINMESTFYSEVIHKTLGGTIPFIFQPDNTDKTNFALCKLDTNSFQFSRQDYDVYNFSIRVVEI
tara:strand:- start:1704 stop:2843 length:1140 start_codon:yes stop_codon:yes gene_type:complete